MNNPTIGERLRHAMGAMTQEQLSEKSGVPQSTINRILNGNSLEPRRSNVAKLAHALDIDTDWLYTGTPAPEGHIPVGARPGVHDSAHELNPESYLAVPRGEYKFSGGNGTSNAVWVDKGDDEDPITFRRAWYKKRGLHHESLRAIYVRGKSMQPVLMDWDTVLIDIDDHDPVDGEIYAFSYKGRFFIKTFHTTQNGILFKSENPDYENIEIVGDDIKNLKVLGKKVWRAG